MDNLYPNDGETFYTVHEPEDQVIDRKREKAETLQAAKELQKVIDRFDKRIAETDSIENARELAKTYELSIENALAVMTVVKSNLLAEKQIITDLLEVHKGKR